MPQTLQFQKLDVVQRVEQVSVGQQVTVKLSEGSITASVLGTQEERHGKEITEL